MYIITLTLFSLASAAKENHKKNRDCFWISVGFSVIVLYCTVSNDWSLLLFFFQNVSALFQKKQDSITNAPCKPNLQACKLGL